MQAGLRTFSVQSGVPKVFWICIGLLEIAYVGAIAVGVGSTVSSSLHPSQLLPLVPCHNLPDNL